MTLSELTVQVPSLKENHNDIYNGLVDFSKLIISNGHQIHNVQFSKVSSSVYVEYSLYLDNDPHCGYCVRFSDHAAKGKVGNTDLYYCDHLSAESNYEEVENHINEN